MSPGAPRYLYLVVATVAALAHGLGIARFEVVALFFAFLGLSALVRIAEALERLAGGPRWVRMPQRPATPVPKPISDEVLASTADKIDQLDELRWRPATRPDGLQEPYATIAREARANAERLRRH